MIVSSPMLRAVALAAALVTSGCAITPETIRIGYPRPTGVAPVEGAAAIRVRVEVVDLRPDKSLVVARKMNAWGMQMAPISSEEPLTSVLAGAIATELAVRGYPVGEDGKVPVTLELVLFSHEFRMGFFSIGSDATVSIIATVRDAAGKELFRGSFSGPFECRCQLAVGYCAREAYEGALPVAVRQLVSSVQFQQALAAAAAGAAAPPSM
jgi:uncharacterized lipoprotein YajG